MTPDFEITLVSSQEIWLQKNKSYGPMLYILWNTCILIRKIHTIDISFFYDVYKNDTYSQTATNTKDNTTNETRLEYVETNVNKSEDYATRPNYFPFFTLINQQRILLSTLHVFPFSPFLFLTFHFLSCHCTHL